MKATCPEPSSITEAFERMTPAWKTKDYDSCRHLLNYICENVSDELGDLLLKNINAAMGLFKLFAETGLDNAMDETPARVFYLKVVRETFNHYFPNLKPTGFNENGDHLYSLDILAKRFDMSMEELLNVAQRLPDVEVFSAGIPDDVTIH